MLLNDQHAIDFMAKHKIRFSDGNVFEITDEEMTKPVGKGVMIPYDIIEKSIKNKGVNP